MQERDGGRYCLSCQKTVLDFSNKTEGEIIAYFTDHFNIPTCGRFKKQQLATIRLHIPTYLFEKKLPGWKRFLLIFLVCFGTFAMNIEVAVAQKEVPGVEKRMKRNVKPISKKNKLKRKKQTKIIVETISWLDRHDVEIIYGMVVNLLPEEFVLQLPSDQEHSNYSSVNESHKSELPDRKKENPFQRTECYLPAVTRFRRSIRKRKN